MLLAQPAEAGAAAAEEGEESEGDSEDGEGGEERKKSWGAAVEAGGPRATSAAPDRPSADAGLVLLCR